jgi:hypothetical protein
MPKTPSTKEILEKYSSKLESEINSSVNSAHTSLEYQKFKQEMSPELSRYERWAKSLGNIIKIKISQKDRKKVQDHLITAHLDVTPEQALTLSVISMLSIFFLTIIITTAHFLIIPNAQFQTLFLFLGIISSLFIFYYTYTMPKRLANIWRLKASSQMVPAILYTVVYMKHTSNLERAVQFAAQHLQGPLALDFKKIFYDIQIGKYSTIKESLDSYLEIWKFDAPEFVEAFHLIESSLFEPSEDRRVQILEKSLQVILDGVYEKMQKYSRSIRSPLTNIYMLGIILPTLGLALLPLASTLLGGIFQAQHVFVIFNVLIPFLVFYMVSQVMLKRPSGYGESSIIELDPNYSEFTSKKPWIKAALISFPILLIGLLPFIFQLNFLISPIGLQSDYTLEELGLPFLQDIKLFDFKTLDDKTIGPFSPIAVILSLFIPLSIGLFFSIAYKQKTKNLIISREKTLALEAEFTNTIFQLGNRLGSGIPPEIAFSKVAESTENQKTHDFFSLVNQNIQQGGMSLEPALFDKKRGAIIFFPSPLISTSMRILLQSVKKGLKVAARSLMSISEYIKNINKINNRLKDLLAEIVSDMKSNMTFLAPLLSGIVVGLSAMITIILNKLQNFQENLSGGADSTANLGNIGNIANIFDVTQMIPPYFIQTSIGLYIIEVIFILTIALVTVNAGKDSLQEKNQLAKNLKIGLILYTITAFITILALTLLATIALANIG